MKSRIFFPFLVVVAGFVFWSCQTIASEFQEPNVSLNSVEIAGISFSGVDLIVTVDVENPNRRAIPMPSVDWELFIKDALILQEAPFLQGNMSNNESIGRRQSVTLAVPVSFTFDGLYRSFASLVELKEAAYNIALKISFPNAITGRVFELDYSGVLPLPQFPAMSFGQARISNISFSGVELIWDINVENPNRFPIPFPSLNWNYSVDGVPVIQSNFTGAGEIAAGAAGVATISVNMVYADVFSAVGAVLTGDASSHLSIKISPEDINFPLPALEGGIVQGILEIPGTIPILRKPEISFNGITRRALGLNRFEFDVIWEVDNRNNFGFGIGEFNCEFRVNNNLWAQGRVEDPPWIAANGRTLIPINVVITTPAVVQGLLPIMSGGGNVNYTAIGNMSFLPDHPGLEALNFPLDFSGSTRIR